MSGLERRAFLLALLVHGLLLLGVVRYEPAPSLPGYTVRLAPVPAEKTEEARLKAPEPPPKLKPAEAPRGEVPPPRTSEGERTTPQPRVSPAPPRALEGEKRPLPPSPASQVQAEAPPLPQETPLDEKAPALSRSPGSAEAPARGTGGLEAAPPAQEVFTTPASKGKVPLEERETPVRDQAAIPAQGEALAPAPPSPAPVPAEAQVSSRSSGGFGVEKAPPPSRSTGGLEVARPAQETFTSPASKGGGPTAEGTGSSVRGQAETLAPTPPHTTPVPGKAQVPSPSGLAVEKTPPAPSTLNPLSPAAQAPGALPERGQGLAREAALPPSRPAGGLGQEDLFPSRGVQGGKDRERCAVVVDTTPFSLDPNPNPQVLTPEGRQVWPPVAKVQGVPTEVVERSGIALFFPQGAFDPGRYGRVLWVKALGTRTRTPESKFHDLVVVSREDAARIQVAAESLCEMVFLYARR